MMKHATPLRLAALIGAAFLFNTPAAAQDEGGGTRRTAHLGIGGQLLPKYPGADEVGFSPMPIIDLRREGEPLSIEAPDEGWGFGLLGRDSTFNIGPALRFQGERDEEDVGAAVGDVDFTVEAGAFVEVSLGRSFRLRAEGRKGLGGHDGWLGDLSADFVATDGDTYVFTIGPRARIADDEYHDAYFSVTPAVAAATGLPAFDAGGGFHAVGASAGLTYMLSRNWGVYGYAGYDRLVGDAADSPIVRAFGSRDQFSGGIGLFYAFGLTL